MTMKTVMTDKQRKEVFRLTDMVVKEVSIVDRPANLRPFALIKAEGSQGAALEPDGQGGFRLAPVDKATVEPEVETPAGEPTVIEPEPVAEVAKGVEVDDALIASALTPVAVVEKVGRKLASKREKAIRDAIELLVSVLDDTTKAVASVTAANVSLTEKLAQAQHGMAALRNEHETLKAEHVTAVRGLAKARGTVQKSNALTDEGKRVETGRVSWPSDLNQ